MEPTRHTHYTLVDLLDRVLDKGLVIHADVIISVAGIPLVGVNLRAAVAGMETMLRYGIMQPWDEQVRSWERAERQRSKDALLQDEQVGLQLVGSYHQSKGIYCSWRWGQVYLTSTRLLLWLPTFQEVIFETPLNQIRAFSLVTESGEINSHNHETLYLLLEGDRIARLRAPEAARLKEAIEETTTALELAPEELGVRSEIDGVHARALRSGEEIVCSNKMWHLVLGDMKGSDAVGTWRPGHLYLTKERVFWWHDFAQRTAFDVSLQELKAVALEAKRGLHEIRERSVLDLVYDGQDGKQVASFSGQQLDQWENALNQVLSGQSIREARPGMEACPDCGQEDQVQMLLEDGCNKCGWVSPRMKREPVEPAPAIET